MERTEIEEAHLEILSDVLGISVAELCPEDKLNYQCPTTLCFRGNGDRDGTKRVDKCKRAET